MDSLSQMVLGAGVAEAVLGKKVGNRAPLWGAIAGTIPDLDVIPAQWMDAVAQLAFHRGITHSVFFALVLAPLLGWMVSSLYRQRMGTFRDWTLLFFLVLLTHSILDCFTTWGVQLFWPLEYRVNWSSIFVIDPFYTLPFLVCLVWLMTKPRESDLRRKLAIAGLVISTGYLGLTLVNKFRVNRVFEKAFARQEMKIQRFETRPTPLQNVLWTAHGETEKAFYIGFHSFFDDDAEIEFQRHEKNQDLPQEVATHPKVQKLKTLTQEWYNLEVLDSNRWALNDFRFGQTGNYQSEAGDFVFSYEIELTPEGEVNIKQRETTSAKAGKEMLKGLWKRVWGDG